jgi:hypothetical protein
MKRASPSFFMRFLALAFLLRLPAAAQHEVARPASTPAAGASSTLSDISSSYARMEANIEQEYAKLEKQAKDDIDALENKIKEIDRQIASLKERARKVSQVAAKMDELLPKFMAALGRNAGGGTGRAASSRRDQVAAQVGTELAQLGVAVSPDQLTKIMDGLEKGGSAGMAQALSICTAIAEAESKRIDGQLGTAAASKQDQKTRIAALDNQLAKFEADRQKAIAALKVQKEKALADAQKARDSRLLHLPTPTPARKP